MSRHRFSHHVLGALTLAVVRSAAVDLPYNPTRIFLDDSTNYAYIVQPDSDGQAQLISIDIAKSLRASDLSTTTLYPSFPFLNSKSQDAILAVGGTCANITIISGKCSTMANVPEVWTFTPGSGKKDGNGTWAQNVLSTRDGNRLGGVSFLSSAISYSDVVGGNSSDSSLFVFGGMCPFVNSTTSTWTTAASYSNGMVEYVPEEGEKGTLSYTAQSVSSRDPPIAEAGFSMTPLAPSYTVRSSSGTQMQQQNFLLIGGHAGSAFINMSNLALYSLPEASWTFIPITASSSSTVIEPRSGHTAVLNEDGNKVVVFGGWVGDVSTPATPQLAILEIGSGYGGLADWAWTQAANANLSGAGIYGHGAVMLPGNVMMVAGGYSIPSTSVTSRLFRRSTPSSSSQTLFYNLTSGSWISSYDPPASVTSSSTTTTDNSTEQKGALTTTSQKAGLGVGLTIGVLLLLALVVYFLWYIPRHKKRQQAREADKEGLMRRTDTFGNSWFGPPSLDGRGSSTVTGSLWGEKGDGYSFVPQDVQTEQPMTEPRHNVERSGLMVNIPSPNRGLRKAAITRAQYQYHAAPRYDDGRVSRSSGNIHPIEERDEEEDRLSTMNGSQAMSTPEKQLKALQNILLDDRTAEDPFKDPMPNPLRSHPVSPEVGPPLGSSIGRSGTDATNASNATNATDQVSDWLREWTTSYAAATRTTSEQPTSISSGRASPTKSEERTSSNLSEQSDRSGFSASARSMARTSSTRSALFFGMSGTPSVISQQSPLQERFHIAPTIGRSRSPLHTQYKPYTDTPNASLHPIRPGAERTITGESHSTAGTTWGQLIEQGEALLGSAHPTIAPLSYVKRCVPEQQPALQQQQQDADLLLANSGPAPPVPPRRRLNWMGSIRKALGSAERSLSTSSALHPRAYAIPQNQEEGEPYYDRSANTSPTKSLRSGRIGAASYTSGVPRRTASDGSEFLRLKRGPRDWEPAGSKEPADIRWVQPYSDDPPSPDLGDWGEGMVPEIHVQKYSDNPIVFKKRRLGNENNPRDSAMGDCSVNNKTNEEEGDDWDVEQLAAKRDVQVLFTLPKATLRVVNADPERASQRSVSEGAVSVKSNLGGATRAVSEHANTPMTEDMTRMNSRDDATSLESWKTAQAGPSSRNDDERGSAETIRKASNYGKEIADWEREALQRRDREETRKEIREI